MKISIITVVKNNIQGIEKTINSVLEQTYKELEYIIIDSESTDGTSEVIYRYKKKLKHTREADFGIYDGINKGIRYATGEFIGLLHSGDTYYSKFSIERALLILKKKNLDAVSFNMQYINETKKVIRDWHLPIKKLNEFNCYKIAHPTLIIKKKILKETKYSLNYQIASDYDFLLKLSKIKNLKYEYYDFDFQINEFGGISTSFKFLSLKIFEDLKILRKRFSYIYLAIFFIKIFSKIRNFIYIERKYEILFIHYYLSDNYGFGDTRHYKILESISKYINNCILLGCPNNQFQNNKKFRFNKLQNTNLYHKNIQSIKYKGNFLRVMSILIFNIKILLNVRLFLYSKKIYLTVPDYTIIFFPLLISKLFNKDLVVEFRDVYPQNIRPIIKNKILFFLIEKISQSLESMALKYSKYIISNLPLYRKRIFEINKNYIKKLFIIPNISEFKTFNKSKDVVYAGNISAINNYKSIKKFLELHKGDDLTNQFLLGSNNYKSIQLLKLKKKLKFYGFGVFSFDNIFSAKYGINHKKLNLYLDCGLIPLFFGDKKKFSNKFHKHLPIHFFTNQFKKKFELLKYLSNVKKIYNYNQKKILRKIEKTNMLTTQKLIKIFIID